MKDGKKDTDDDCGPGDKVNPGAKRGHIFQYARSGRNLCVNCGMESPYRFAEDMKGVQRPTGGRERGRLVAILISIGAFILMVLTGIPLMVLMARISDREPQFMDFVGTNVATASDQEDTFDPGYRYEDRIGVRIWRIEAVIGDVVETPFTATTNVTSVIILTTRNETAIPEANADGVIYYEKDHLIGITTSGSPTVVKEKWGQQFYPKGLLTVTDRYYLWFSNDTGVTRKVRLRMWYTTETLTDADYREFFEIWARA